MELKTERTYKDRLIRMIFMEKKENLLSLYNAVNGTHYTNTEDLVVNTLENAIYMNMKNDMSFIFDFFLNLYEHQATFNPNMPLRKLFYLSKLLQGLVKDRNLYGTRLVKIPTPRFVVFYNGTEEAPERQALRLSEAFEKPMEDPEVELCVTVLNINPGYNRTLMESCRLLKEYMLYVEKVRIYAKETPIREAVDRAVTESIREGILVEFLTKYRAEAIEVSIFEYDEEAHMRKVREEGWELGREKGLEEGLELGREKGCTEGEWRKLISQVRKKLDRGFNTSAIAEMLEEPEPFIEEIIRLIEENPGKTEQELGRIYAKVRKEA